MLYVKCRPLRIATYEYFALKEYTKCLWYPKGLFYQQSKLFLITKVFLRSNDNVKELRHTVLELNCKQ